MQIEQIARITQVECPKLSEKIFCGVFFPAAFASVVFLSIEDVRGQLISIASREALCKGEI